MSPIAFALLAMVSWGVGDFLIQQSSRRVGIVRALFWICAIGGGLLFPFVLGDIASITARGWVLIGTAAVVMFFASLFDFEALKDGKIAIIEPVLAGELPLTIGLSVGLARESLTSAQQVAILVIVVGILLAVTTHPSKAWHHRRRLFERGVIYAGLGAIGMGLTNFSVGIASQHAPVLASISLIWLIIAVLSMATLLIERNTHHLADDLRRHGPLLASMAVADTMAWIFYSFATSAMYISVANAMSESYVIIAAVLGVVVNHERLKRHQQVGAALAFVGVIWLASIS
ncbi:DMT family transporter [Candidatus Uhrbacteria bacterium]|nr:DMT family transporter [Candidatus Uhrbacteria bacterium]